MFERPEIMPISTCSSGMEGFKRRQHVDELEDDDASSDTPTTTTQGLPLQNKWKLTRSSESTSDANETPISGSSGTAKQ